MNYLNRDMKHREPEPITDWQGVGLAWFAVALLLLCMGLGGEF